MKTLLFDGTFEGLLTLIYHGYKEKEEFMISSISNYQQSVFDNQQYIDTDSKIHEKLETYIVQTMGHDILMVMYKAYLSEIPTVYNFIFKFFKKAMKFKGEVIYMHSDKDILPVLNAQKKVSRESHFMTGALRFKKSRDGLLYAQYAPESNITSLIAPHFTDRLISENFVIHDVKRNIYAFYNKSECIIGTFSDLPSIEWKDMDKDYEDLWKNYFKHISIKERENRKLQISHMPLKYWHYLTEKQPM